VSWKDFGLLTIRLENIDEFFLCKWSFWGEGREISEDFVKTEFVFVPR
jgi:hypothetical protein